MKAFRITSFAIILATSASLALSLFEINEFKARAENLENLIDVASIHKARYLERLQKKEALASRQHSRTFLINQNGNIADSNRPAVTQPTSENAHFKAPQSVADLASNLIGAVVNISTSLTVEGVEDTDNLSIPPNDSSEKAPFDEYFQDFFSNKDGKGRKQKAQSLGSGFIIDAEKGLVVTNNHVIADADDIEVNFSDGSKLKAKLLGKDGKTDIALLQIDAKAKKLKAVSFGDSKTSRIGDWVMAIGNPFGFGGSVSLGIISARNRNINSGPYDDFIQTDAAINRGNSGGPLFDMNGRVIGINTAIVSPSGGSIGIGFAIPSELALGVVEQLRDYGHTRRGWLAIRIQPVTADIAAAFNLPKTEGAVVSGHIGGTFDVDNKRLRDGDIILSYNGEEVKDARLLPRMVAESRVGYPVPVEVWRKGKKITLSVTPGLLRESAEENNDDEPASNDYSSEQQEASPWQDNQKTEYKHLLGMELAQVDDKIRKNFSINKQVKGVAVLSVDVASNAQEKHIVAGDVIVAVNQETVNTEYDIEKRLASLKDSGRKNALLMLAAPTGELRFVTVLLD